MLSTPIGSFNFVSWELSTREISEFRSRYTADEKDNRSMISLGLIQKFRLGDCSELKRVAPKSEPTVAYHGSS